LAELSRTVALVRVGVYIRLEILETPTFSRLLAENRIERAPVFEVIKRQPKSIILVALAKMGQMVRSASLLMGQRGSSRDLLLSAPRRLSGHVILCGPHRRVSVGSHRPQAHVSDGLGRHRGVWVHLFCAAEQI
jgi:hypothetical protein